MTGLVNVDFGSIAKAIIGSEGLDGWFTTDEERAAAALRLEVELQKPHILQAMANLKAAEHPSWFVAGARPALLWVCVAGLAYTLLIYPFAGLIAHFAGLPSDLPPLDESALMTMTLSLLGLGGLRSWEKGRGVARERDPVTRRDIGPPTEMY